VSRHENAGVAGDGFAADDDERQDGELRTKYRDYCAAQIHEVILGLPDEEVYRIVEKTAGEQGGRGLAFRERVRIITEHLRENMPLPDFDEWADSYRRNPQMYDAYMSGPWAGLARGAGGSSESGADTDSAGSGDTRSPES